MKKKNENVAKTPGTIYLAANFNDSTITKNKTDSKRFAIYLLTFIKCIYKRGYFSKFTTLS